MLFMLGFPALLRVFSSGWWALSRSSGGRKAINESSGACMFSLAPRPKLAFSVLAGFFQLLNHSMFWIPYPTRLPYKSLSQFGKAPGCGRSM